MTQSVHTKGRTIAGPQDRFSVDVDNTLLNNDAFRRLERTLESEFAAPPRALLEDLRDSAFRVAMPITSERCSGTDRAPDAALLRMSTFLIDIRSRALVSGALSAIPLPAASARPRSCPTAMWYSSRAK